jgi:protein-serine/threonine kinase
MYEMLIGYPPFCSETPHETYQKIMNWKQELQFPEDVHISPDALNLMKSLICESSLRLGNPERGGFDIKQHSFFRGVDFDIIRTMQPPFVPSLTSITDTSYFPTDDIENELEIASSPSNDSDTIMQKKDLAFVGYTFRKFDNLTRKNAI